MSIKLKKGKCCDCGKEKPDQYLMAGRCKTHYWKHRKVLNEKRRKAQGVNISANQDKKDFDNWFLFQISNMPAACENWDAPLNKFACWAARSYVAHILPKRHFKSVALHPVNRLFLCIQCHGDYDNRGWSKAMKMPVWHKAVERLLIIAPSIASQEVYHLPDCLLELKIS